MIRRHFNTQNVSRRIKQCKLFRWIHNFFLCCNVNFGEYLRPNSIIYHNNRLYNFCFSTTFSHKLINKELFNLKIDVLFCQMITFLNIANIIQMKNVWNRVDGHSLNIVKNFDSRALLEYLWRLSNDNKILLHFNYNLAYFIFLLLE